MQYLLKEIAVKYHTIQEYFTVQFAGSVCKVCKGIIRTHLNLVLTSNCPDVSQTKQGVVFQLWQF